MCMMRVPPMIRAVIWVDAATWLRLTVWRQLRPEQTWLYVVILSNGILVSEREIEKNTNQIIIVVQILIFYFFLYFY